MQTLHEGIRGGTAGVPSTGTIPELALVCREGGVCLADLGCDDRPWNHTIGYNKELVLSGIDNILDVFIEHVSVFRQTHQTRLGHRKNLPSHSPTSNRPQPS